MVQALTVESGNCRKTQQMCHSLPNLKHSQQGTTHLTRPSWNQYVSSHQPNHVSPSALSRCSIGDTSIENNGCAVPFHCQCKCASLVSEQQPSRENTVIFSVLPRFDHRSLHCSCHFGFLGYSFLVHRKVLTQTSRCVALVTVSGFFTLLAFALGFTHPFWIV